MHAVLDLLKELNQKQKIMDDGYDTFLSPNKERRGELLHLLKQAGFSVIYHKEVGRWMIYCEDRTTDE